MSATGERTALPRGARDLLPPESRNRQIIVDRILTIFESWGYERVVTPAIEYFEIIERGLSSPLRARTVRFIEPATGEIVALRTDITPQIARLVGQRGGGQLPTDAEIRLSYAADTVRQPDDQRARAEQHQVGVELIGDPSPYADAELIALCHAVLRDLGIRGARIELAETGVVREFLNAAGAAPGAREELHACLQRKDAEGARAAVRRAGLPSRSEVGIARLCSLHGSPAIVAQARTALVDLGVDEPLQRFDALLDVVRRESPEAWEALLVDLGEVRGFDYYTGMRLRVWGRGVSTPLAGGGRYDDLLGRYGEPRPATGFAFDLDALEAALVQEGALPADARPPAAVVVVPRSHDATDDATRRDAAMAAARQERAAGRRAWIWTGLTVSRAVELAAARGVDRVLEIGPGGTVTRTHTVPRTTGRSP